MLRRAVAGALLWCNLVSSSSKPVSVPVFVANRVSRGRTGRRFGVEVAATDQFSGLTVVQLKDLLRDNGLPVSGKKSELIRRIAEHSSGPQPSSNPSSSQEDDEVLLGGLTVPQLTARLKDLGLPISGRKKELIERILEHEHPKVGDSVELDGEDNNDSDAGVVSVISDLDEAISGEGALGEISDLDEAISEEGLGKNLAGMLGDILNESASDVGDIEGDEAKNDSRRARRKKYWKTSEVKDMIRSNDPRASAKAEELISYLKKMAEQEGDPDYLPGPIQYTLLIDAFAQGIENDGPEAMLRAESVVDNLLNEAESSSTVSPQMLNSLMSAYVKLGTQESAEKATLILQRLEYMGTFGDTAMKPTIHSYSIAISAWSAVGTEEAAANAERILNRLIEIHAQQKDADRADELCPNNIIFNTAVDAWARSGSAEAGPRAESLLHKMEKLSHDRNYDVRPDTITFNTCMKAWCNSPGSDGLLRAEELMKKLESHPEYPKRNGGILIVKPSRLSYNQLISAWAKSQYADAAIRAESVLLRMIKAYKADTYSTCAPDSHSLASCLNALAKSRTVNFKAKKCLSLLDAMSSAGLKSNTVCFNTVLNAAGEFV